MPHSVETELAAMLHSAELQLWAMRNSVELEKILSAFTEAFKVIVYKKNQP
jgi:hypothetical protein